MARRTRKKKTTWSAAIFLEVVSIGGIIAVAQPEASLDVLRNLRSSATQSTSDSVPAPDLPDATGDVVTETHSDPAKRGIYPSLESWSSNRAAILPHTQHVPQTAGYQFRPGQRHSNVDRREWIESAEFDQVAKTSSW